MRIIIGALALLSSTAAQADVAGTYQVEGQQLVVEANEDGRIRIDSAKAGEYTLLTPDGAFVVFEDETGVKVASMAAFTAAVEEMMAQMWRDLGADPAGMKSPEPLGERFVVNMVGEETVNGYTGKVYREVLPAAADDALDAEEDSGTRKPAEIVLTDDPALAPLGDAWSHMATMMPSFGRLISGSVTAQEADFANLLKGKGVLRLDAIALTAVSFDPIADDRFVLPAEPMSQDEVKAMLASGEGE